METKVQATDNDLKQIKAINEDNHWAKEYGIPKEYLQSERYDRGIYDLIVESHIKTQASGK